MIDSAWLAAAAAAALGCALAGRPRPFKTNGTRLGWIQRNLAQIVNYRTEIGVFPKSAALRRAIDHEDIAEHQSNWHHADSMNLLSVYFRHRKMPVIVPVTDESFERIRERMRNESEGRFSLDLTSLFGQRVLINEQNVQCVRFLFEVDPPPFTESDILPSPWEKAEEPELDPEVLWDLDIWLNGRDDPLQVTAVSGYGWIMITTSLEGVSPKFLIEDGDGEDFGCFVEAIDLIVAREFIRYSEEQRIAVETEVR